MTTSHNDKVREGGLRSDGELVQAQDHFDFRAPPNGPSGPCSDEPHEKWIDLLCMGQVAGEVAPFGRESLTIAHEAIDRPQDAAQTAPADDLL